MTKLQTKYAPNKMSKSYRFLRQTKKINHFIASSWFTKFFGALVLRALLMQYFEKQADIKSAKLFGTARGLIDTFEQVQEINKHNSQFNKFLFSSKGECNFDVIHPALAKRITYLKPLVVESK